MKVKNKFLIFKLVYTMRHDPYQNDADPQHCLALHVRKEFFLYMWGLFCWKYRYIFLFAGFVSVYRTVHASDYEQILFGRPLVPLHWFFCLVDSCTIPNRSHFKNSRMLFFAAPSLQIVIFCRLSKSIPKYWKDVTWKHCGRSGDDPADGVQRQQIWVWDPGSEIRDSGSEIRDPEKTYSGSRIRVQG